MKTSGVHIEEAFILKQCFWRAKRGPADCSHPSPHSCSSRREWVSGFGWEVRGRERDGAGTPISSTRPSANYGLPQPRVDGWQSLHGVEGRVEKFAILRQKTSQRPRSAPPDQVHGTTWRMSEEPGGDEKGQQEDTCPFIPLSWPLGARNG